MKSAAWLVISALWIAVASTAYAGDSPQFRGPHRDGKFDEKGLLKAWPESGPPVLWTTRDLGSGYASVSVAAGKIYVPGMLDDKNGYIFVLNADGKLDRKILYGKETLADAAPGSRSTPTLDGSRLYILSGLGVIYCIDLTTDKIVWQVNILERFGAKEIEWELAESLLVDKDRVICTPGGTEASVAALDKNTGETVWKTPGIGEQTGYISPIIVNHKGRRILLDDLAVSLIGVDADTGALLWKHEHRTEYDIHAVTPVYHDGCVYYSAGYKSGGGLIEIAPDGASVKVLWTDTKLDCQHHGVVLVDGYLYGTGHRNAKLMCLDWKTGNQMWETKDIRQGVVEYADGMLYVYEGPKEGVVSLVKPSSTGFERTGQFTVTEGQGNHWAHPTIANGRLYIRHGDTLIAYDIKAK